MKYRKWMLTVGVSAAVLAWMMLDPATPSALAKVKPGRTKKGAAESATSESDPFMRLRLKRIFSEAGCAYPSGGVTLLAVKDEKRLELWGADSDGTPRLVKEYKILAASGETGPKLVEGDRQVPEGVYSIIGMNPNSRFHLSMKIDYPNSFDRKMARSDGRTKLGGDICIHGKWVSIGCIAVGDEAIEELYQLVQDTGRSRVKVIIAPYDFRIASREARDLSGLPKWTPELYKKIESEMAQYKKARANDRITRRD